MAHKELEKEAIIKVIAPRNEYKVENRFHININNRDINNLLCNQDNKRIHQINHHP